MHEGMNCFIPESMRAGEAMSERVYLEHDRRAQGFSSRQSREEKDLMKPRERGRGAVRIHAGNSNVARVPAKGARCSDDPVKREGGWVGISEY